MNKKSRKQRKRTSDRLPAGADIKARKMQETRDFKEEMEEKRKIFETAGKKLEKVEKIRDLGYSKIGKWLKSRD